MTRKDEWDALLREAADMPAELESAIDRAASHAARNERRKRRTVGTFGSLAGIAAAFVLLVNASTPFAMAASRVPFLRPLVEAVAFDPSLKEAVAHDYVQLVQQTGEQDGITVKLEYLIADPRNLTVFYTVQDTDLRPVMLEPELLSADGEALPVSGTFGEESMGMGLDELSDSEQVQKAQSQLHKWKFHFSGDSGDTLPEQIRLHVKTVLDGRTRQKLGAAFDFALTIEPRFLKSVRTFRVDQTISVLGQQLTVDAIEVYPTNTRIVWRTDPGNDAWLTWLPFYLTDQNNAKVDGIMNGVSGVAGDQSDGWGETWLESAWFDTAKVLTVHLDAAAALPKEETQVTLYADGRTEGLPAYIRPVNEQYSGDPYFAGAWNFAVQKGAYSSNTGILANDYTDAAGKRFEFNGESLSAYTESLDGWESDFTCHYRFDPEAEWPVTVTLRFASGEVLADPITVNTRP